MQFGSPKSHRAKEVKTVNVDRVVISPDPTMNHKPRYQPLTLSVPPFVVAEFNPF